MIPFEKRAIMDFMHSLPIRKVHGVGRVNERLLDSIGITVRRSIGSVFIS